MAQQLKTLAALAEDPRLVPSNTLGSLQLISNSSSSAPSTLFWSLRVPALMGTQIHTHN